MAKEEVEKKKVELVQAWKQKKEEEEKAKKKKMEEEEKAKRKKHRDERDEAYCAGWMDCARARRTTGVLNSIHMDQGLAAYKERMGWL